MTASIRVRIIGQLRPGEDLAVDLIREIEDQDLEVGDSFRIGDDPVQQRFQVPTQPLDGRRVEQVGVVLDGQVQRPGTGPELQDQVEPGRRSGQVLLGDPQAVEVPLPHHGVLQHHHGLRQGRATRISLRLELLHQPVERHLVMGEHIQHRLADLGQEVAERLSEYFPQVALTPREVEVLGLVAKGMANKEIASKLGTASGTVKMHIQNILAKLGASDRTHT